MKLASFTPFVFRTVMEKYGFTAANPFCWEAFFTGLPIEECDLSALVRATAFWFEGNLLQRSDCDPKRPKFECEGCMHGSIACKSHFALKFNKSKDSRFYFLVPEKSSFVHHTCKHSHFVLKDSYRAMMEIYANSPVLQDYFKSHFDSEDFSDATSYKKAMAFLASKELRGVSMSCPTFSRVSTFYKNLHLEEQVNYHFLLRSFLIKYVEDNPTANAFLQADDRGCFYRMFVTIPEAASLFKSTCIPALFIDGSFSKIDGYDGCLVCVTAADGESGNAPLAAAWVPRETSSGMLFVLLMLAASGFDFSCTPVFTDRGHLLSAVTVAWHLFGIEVSLKYCLEHIIRNVNHKFSIQEKDGRACIIRRCISDMQGATSIASFLLACEKLRTAIDEDTASEVITYLMKNIHPRHWTVFGNNHEYPDEQWAPAFFGYLGVLCGYQSEEWLYVQNHIFSDPVPLGKKFPLFGFARNNRAESTFAWLAKKKVRNSQPPLAVQRFLTVASEAIDNLKTVMLRFRDTEMTHSTVASKLFDDAMMASSFCEIPVLFPDSTIQVVDEMNGYRRTSLVRPQSSSSATPYSCTCYYFSNFGFMCGHVMKTLSFLKKGGMVTGSEDDEVKTTALALPCWGSVDSIARFYSCRRDSNLAYSFRLKCWADITVTTPEDALNPAPAYKLKRVGNGKRKKSNGELGSTLQSSPKSPSPRKKAKTTKRSEPTAKVYLSRKDECRIAEMTKRQHFNAFSDPNLQNIGKMRKIMKRDREKVNRCSKCGIVGHNVGTCYNQKLLFDKEYRHPKDLKQGRILLAHVMDRNVLIKNGISFDVNDLAGGIFSAAVNSAQTGTLSVEDSLSKEQPRSAKQKENVWFQPEILDRDVISLSDYKPKRDIALELALTAVHSRIPEINRLQTAEESGTLAGVSTPRKSPDLRAASDDEGAPGSFGGPEYEGDNLGSGGGSDDESHPGLCGESDDEGDPKDDGCFVVNDNNTSETVEQSSPIREHESSPVSLTTRSRCKERTLPADIADILDHLGQTDDSGIISMIHHLQTGQIKAFLATEEFYLAYGDTTARRVIEVCDSPPKAQRELRSVKNKEKGIVEVSDSAVKLEREPRRSKSQLNREKAISARVNNNMLCDEMINEIVQSLRGGGKMDTSDLVYLGRNPMGDEIYFSWKRTQMALAAVRRKDAKLPIAFSVVYCGDHIMEMRHLTALRSATEWLCDSTVDSFTWSVSKLLEAQVDVQVHPSWASSTLRMTLRKGKEQLYDLANVCFAAQSLFGSANKRGIHLFPQCNNVHWWLMVVDLRDRTIYSLDSMKNGDHLGDANALCSLLKVGLCRRVQYSSKRRSLSKEEWTKSIPDFNGWNYIKLMLPAKLQQNDSSNCGVFVCHFCASLIRIGRATLKDIDLIQLPSKKMAELRGYIFGLIMQMGTPYFPEEALASL